MADDQRAFDYLLMHGSHPNEHPDEHAPTLVRAARDVLQEVAAGGGPNGLAAEMRPAEIAEEE